MPRDLRIRTKATPDGQAFYPFGSWGGGYILDGRARRRLATWSRWRLWVQTGLMVVVLPDFMPGSAGVRMLVFGAGMTALIGGIYWFSARSCPRTDVRLTAAESLRMQAETITYGQLGFALCLFPVLIAFIAWQSVLVSPAKQWGPIVGAIALAIFVWSFVHTIRLRRLKGRMDRDPATQPIARDGAV